MKKHATKLILLMLVAIACAIMATRLIVHFEMQMPSKFETEKGDSLQYTRLVARERWGGAHAVLPTPVRKDGIPPHIYGRLKTR